MFSDSAEFQGDITTAIENQCNNRMELYAQNVLTLFVPHRHKGELISSKNNTRYPHVQRLQELYKEDEEQKRCKKPLRIFLFPTKCFCRIYKMHVQMLFDSN